MRITFRVDGQDFEELEQAVEYVTDKHFPNGGDIQTEKEIAARGYTYDVFDEAEDSSYVDEAGDKLVVKIYEIRH
jgi:hypothetical protein